MMKREVPQNDFRILKFPLVIKKKKKKKKKKKYRERREGKKRIQREIEKNVFILGISTTREKLKVLKTSYITKKKNREEEWFGFGLFVLMLIESY